MAVAFVERGADSGVDGQFFHGILVVDLQQTGKFLRLFQTDPGLQGHGQGGLCVNGLQKSIQPIRICQHTAAFSLAHHGAGGTTQIDIYFLIAQLAADIDGPEHVFHVLAQKLWNSCKSHTVRLGQFPRFPGCQTPMNGGGDEGHEITVHAGEILLMEPPEGGICNALQGREIILHQTSR